MQEANLPKSASTAPPIFGTSAALAPNNKIDEAPRDLGFGSSIPKGEKRRLLNKDGSFNVHRLGVGLSESRSLYHLCLTTSWPRFLFALLAVYLVTNILFGTGYYLCGSEALIGLEATTELDRFLESFFFSVQTFATIGYGKLSPNGLAAHLIVTFEALFGLVGFALATGLFFARFSRPNARILFSETAIIAPYRGGSSLQFRIANKRQNQILHLTATVSLSRFEPCDGPPKRQFYSLELERNQVMFFPLNWTIVHPITPKSPLYGWTEEKLAESDAELLVILEGIDDTFSQQVFSSSSYKFDEIRWGAKFKGVLEDNSDGSVSIDLRKLSAVEPAELPLTISESLS